MLEYVGIVGLVLLIIAWVPETIKNWIERKITSRLEFLIFYVAGSLLLAFHAYLIHDLVFLILNSLAFILSFINLVFYFAYKNKKK